MADAKDFDNRFTYHPPSPERAAKHDQIRNACQDIAELVDALVPDSREKSLTLTKIEEAMFWANAALARHAQ